MFDRKELLEHEHGRVDCKESNDERSYSAALGAASEVVSGNLLPTAVEQSAGDAPKTEDDRSADDALLDSASRPFVDRWNRLISHTNWHKGRIIAQWREAMIAAGAPPTSYSDEAWASRVGGITSQHVGRLRRVWERFGAVYQEYPGLYWSHFQAALDWEDAEMWLEGAVHNGWSISRMRARRTEALGRIAEVRPVEEQPAIDLDEPDAESEGFIEDAPLATDDLESADRWIDPCEVDLESGTDAIDADDQAAQDASTSVAADKASAVRPFESLPPLPADVGEAFEAMKLAIVSRRVGGWTDISPDDMLAVLDALRRLVVAPE